MAKEEVLGAVSIQPEEILGVWSDGGHIRIKVLKGEEVMMEGTYKPDEVEIMVEELR